ncbi:hypothetical protein BJ322DRAFT_1025537 [Thelephora terrestris]|uniref:Uncharacterized protein n=1 Tax=Thelephora terrestris TaxID=56493 RepID=A0A9P6L0Y9_9AGAM|nr:hypothetical protein BJ322DRAFT_1025537 [Thelephora terrestris]
MAEHEDSKQGSRGEVRSGEERPRNNRGGPVIRVKAASRQSRGQEESGTQWSRTTNRKESEIGSFDVTTSPRDFKNQPSSVANPITFPSFSMTWCPSDAKGNPLPPFGPLDAIDRKGGLFPSIKNDSPWTFEEVKVAYPSTKGSGNLFARCGG